ESDASDGAEEDGEGHVVGFERPSLLEDLRNILAEYPDDGQIFKEMIQNAEDAGATTIQIFSVAAKASQQRSASKTPVPKEAPRAHTKGSRQKTKQSERVSLRKAERGSKMKSPSRKHDTPGDTKSRTWRPPFLDTFTGPGLCIYNDEKFTNEDWSGIRKLHTSVKAKDPLKVGRFGLGFKSVFHVTDHPVIISGHKLMFMDPFKDEKNAIYEMHLKSLTTEEHQALNCILTGVLHVLPEQCLTREWFEGHTVLVPVERGTL
ncbi:hypothetical protein BaRGS_00020521, partial [Batillaria attramentaria]